MHELRQEGFLSDVYRLVALSPSIYIPTLTTQEQDPSDVPDSPNVQQLTSCCIEKLNDVAYSAVVGPE